MELSQVKKIGIMSDSHDNLPAIRAAIELFHREKVDFVIHAGDLISPFTAREMKKLNCPFEIVLGNNDGEVLGLNRIYDGHIHQPPFELDLGGKKILVLHDGAMVQLVKEIEKYDIVIFGHDHKANINELEDGTLLINPGECGGWLYGKSTVCVLELTTGKTKIYEI